MVRNSVSHIPLYFFWYQHTDRIINKLYLLFLIIIANYFSLYYLFCSQFPLSSSFVGMTISTYEHKIVWVKQTIGKIMLSASTLKMVYIISSTALTPLAHWCIFWFCFKSSTLKCYLYVLLHQTVSLINVVFLSYHTILLVWSFLISIVAYQSFYLLALDVYVILYKYHILKTVAYLTYNKIR